MPSPIHGVLVNLCAWLAIAFGAGWWHRRTPVERLDDDGIVLRLRGFEQGGRWYERRLRIKAWKTRLPETGGRRGGMSKRQLPGRQHSDLERFSAECVRGERTHWTIVAVSPTFALWNDPSAFAAITLANAAGNSPFIAILRYNRARIATIASRRRAARTFSVAADKASTRRPPASSPAPARIGIEWAGREAGR